jgi:hypothetical protein
MMPKRLALVAALLLLMACQQAPVRDENSPRSRVSIGSHFILHQVLAQEGQVVAKNKLERYQPHCNIEVHSVSSGGSYIEPDTFVVTAVMEDEVEVVRGTAWQHYASLFYSGDGMDTLMLSRFVRHTLQSASQPEVMRLTCHGGFAEPWQVATPSVREIRQALGELVTLKLQHSI